MLNTKSFLSVDFGAGSLKVAEFEKNDAGALRLKQFGIKPLGLEGSQEASREKVILKAMQELFAEKSFGSRNINVCAPGFHVFSKFVKLPPVDTSKVTQIIQYEAQQNVPFPLEEVVWDYQILGTTATGELEVLLVAIKADVVEGLFRTAETAGLRLQLVDVSPAALCNAFRFNYSGQEGCTMLLDIGAKTSNLLFFEKGKVYSRGINIGANSITQDFVAESKLPFAQAEQLKIDEGFVSLGGAYEEPENPRQAQISKIARQVMTRLHIQVNQTIQFYRGQQGGTAPQRLFLAGGASIMPYTAQFFAEKLNLPVEYFNPFRHVQIDPSINLEDLAKVAHSFGEVVGLGLRNLAQCPVELNLIPKSLLKRQQFNQKKPYFIAAIFSLVLVVFAYGWFYAKLAAVKQDSLNKLAGIAAPLTANKEKLEKEEVQIKATKKEIEELSAGLEERLFWPDFLSRLRLVLLQTEINTRQRLGADTGLWFESFTPDLPGEKSTMEIAEAQPTPQPNRMMMDPELAKRYGLIPQTPAAPPAEGAPAPAGEGAPHKPASTNQIEIINVVCRGINHHTTKASANNDLAFDFQNQLWTNLLLRAYLDTNGTKLSRELDPPGTDPTFTFGVTLKLKKPIKF